MTKSMAEIICLAHYKIGIPETACAYDGGTILIKNDKKYTYDCYTDTWRVEMIKKNISKCESCTHQGVCKHEQNMQKFGDEINEKLKLMEYAEFSVKIECRHYDGKPVARDLMKDVTYTGE